MRHLTTTFNTLDGLIEFKGKLAASVDDAVASSGATDALIIGDFIGDRTDPHMWVKQVIPIEDSGSPMANMNSLCFAGDASYLSLRETRNGKRYIQFQLSTYCGNKTYSNVTAQVYENKPMFKLIMEYGLPSFVAVEGKFTISESKGKVYANVLVDQLTRMKARDGDQITYLYLEEDDDEDTF